jgi:hypothetical protein
MVGRGAVQSQTSAEVTMASPARICSISPPRARWLTRQKLGCLPPTVAMVACSQD